MMTGKNKYGLFLAKEEKNTNLWEEGKRTTHLMTGNLSP